MTRERSRESVGVLAAIGAYTLWGLVPLYWPLLDPAAPLEVLAHRVVWTLAFVAVLLTVRRSWADVRAVFADTAAMWILAAATVLVTINWGVFIWAVTNGFVLQASLGYFINPLVSVMLGVVVFRERLRPLQWAAVGLGAVAVVVLTAGYGGLPWVALALAGSFALYGLAKKKAGVEAIPSLAIETGLAVPVAVGYLVWLGLAGTGTFGQVSAAHSLLLAGAGVVTAVPLLLFGAAAIRIPLSTLGILQYIGPALQFIIGLVIFGEAMTPLRWVGFVTVWAALAVFTVDALTASAASRSVLRSAAAAARPS